MIGKTHKSCLIGIFLLLAISFLYPVHCLAMYKCQAETAIRYSDSPCANSEKSLPYIAPATTPETSRTTDIGNQSEREKSLLRNMERDRLKHEKDASLHLKQNARQGAISERHELLCAKLRSQLEQAETNLRYSKPKSIESNQQRVERAREKLQFEAC
ncbi:hypothetical protein ACMYR3_14330 [Ampullimonas aquatilis]|uniref:hypothetical protein n=1 Tax=Ampullimonas aquatilis TaxID=1341549 RepID=UPI003C73C2D1